MVDHTYDEVYEDLFQETKCYPDAMPFALSHAEFPATHALMQGSGMPFGFILTPFMRIPPSAYMDPAKVDTSCIARCQGCRAYINSACEANKYRWHCSLCRHRNTFDEHNLGHASPVVQRYSCGGWRGLKELSDSVYDVYAGPVTNEDSGGGGGDGSGSDSSGDTGRQRPLVHVFVLDLSMSNDALLLVVDALTTAITSLHRDMHVLFVTVAGGRISIYKCGADGTWYPEVHPAGSALPRTLELLGTARPVGGSLERCVALLGSVVRKGGQAGTTAPATVVSRLVRWLTASEDQGYSDPLGTGKGAGSTTTTAAMATEGDSAGLSQASEPAFGLPGGGGGHGNRGVVDRAVTGLMGFASALGAALVGTDGGDEDEDEDEGGVGALPQTMSDGLLSQRCDGVHAGAGTGTGTGPAECPASVCSGTIIHLFTPSARSADDTALSPPDSRGLVQASATQGISVHLWVTCSAAEGTSRLAPLLPMVISTGGACTRVSVGGMGVEMEMERGLLTERLRRVFSTPVATRCLLRMRCSPIVSLGDHSGAGVMDANLPNLQSVPVCTPDTSVSATVLYHNLGDNQPSQRGDTIGIQMSFSYEVLMDVSGRGPSWRGHMQGQGLGHEGSTLGRDDDWTAHLGKVDTLLGMAEASANAQDLAFEAAKKGVHSWLGEDTAAQYADNFYSGSEQLRAVRRIRVATVFIRCAAHQRGLARALRPNVSGCLVARTVYQQLLNSGVLSQTMPPTDVVKAIQTAVAALQNWAVSIIAAVVKPMLRAAVQSSTASDDKAGLCYECVVHAISFGQTRALLQTIYGAARLLTAELLPSLVDVQALPAAIAEGLCASMAAARHVASADRQVPAEAALEAVSALLSTRAACADKTLYPKLYSLNEQACLVSGADDALPTLPLSSMSLTAAVAKSGFLLDAGAEVFVCRPAAAPASTFSSPGSATAVPAPLPFAIPAPPRSKFSMPAPPGMAPLPPSSTSAPTAAALLPPSSSQEDVAASGWRSSRWLLNDLRRRLSLAPDGHMPRVRFSTADVHTAAAGRLTDDMAKPLVADFHEWTSEVQNRAVLELN